MKIAKIVVVPKMTKYEFDMFRLKLSSEKVIQMYKDQGMDVDVVLKSHERQKKALRKLKEIFSEENFFSREEFSKEVAENADLVISFGGDNHFLYVTQFLEDTPILGIHADPERSEGALTSFTTDGFKEKLGKIQNDEFKIEEWTRLEIRANNSKLKTLCLSEVFIGESCRTEMSRQIVTLNGVSEEQKGSGMIITTGSGSAGWYNSCSRYLFSKGDLFPRTKKEARFILSEPYSRKELPYKLVHGRITENEELKVQSLSDSQGIISIDALETVDIKEGTTITIKIGKPLKVVKV